MKYLSPSSILDWQRCPHRFKLIRIDENWPEREPVIARETGTAFDALCKCHFNRRFNFERLLKQADIYPGEIPEHTKAVEIAHYLFEGYRESGSLEALANEGVAMVDVGKEIVLGKVPVYGRIDATLTNGTVIDWKVNGANSVRGVSPKYGYSRRFDWNGCYGSENAPHARSDWNLEDISPAWALQVCIYSFLLGHKPGQPLNAGIEQIAVNKDKVAYCSFRNNITPKYQIEVWDLIQEIWETLGKGEVPAPTYQKRKCTMFGKVCEVAHLCTAYQTKEELAWLSP